MTLPKINPTTTKAWSKLISHFNATKKEHLKDLFKLDADRATKFSIEWKDFYLDFSKNRICLLYTSPSPRDRQKSRMPSSA